jgi:predicted HTH domain antitoxin
MSIELPDIETVQKLSPSELRLEFACALYQKGHLGKIAASEFAGVNYFEFQRALGSRGIDSYTEEMLDNDLSALKTLFPE